MSGTPDRLYHMGGVPVASASDFAGWWGNDVWYVDYDNGIRAIDQGKGNMTAPQKDYYQTIQDAAPGDTIYIRPRTTVGTQATNQIAITPATTEAANVTIPRTLHHLSIIGTTGSGMCNSVALQGYAEVNTATITTLAPYLTVENINFMTTAHDSVITQRTGLLKAYVYTPGTHDGFACSINNCTFQNYKDSGNGALWFESGRYNQVMYSHFWHCDVGVRISSAGRTNQGNEVKNCDFHGNDTDIDIDINLSATDHLRIIGNRFHHDIPA